MVWILNLNSFFSKKNLKMFENLISITIILWKLRLISFYKNWKNHLKLKWKPTRKQQNINSSTEITFFRDNFILSTYFSHHFTKRKMIKKCVTMTIIHLKQIRPLVDFPASTSNKNPLYTYGHIIILIQPRLSSFYCSFGPFHQSFSAALPDKK